MAKIKIKLNSKRSTTIRATDGAYYKLRAGENIIELEQDAYSALISALGLKPNNKKQADPKPAVEQCRADNNEQPVESKPAVEQPVEEPVVEQSADRQEHNINTDGDKSCEQISDDVVDTDLFSQMPYSQLKAAYKEITGKNSKLKRNELINFLREHHNAE